MSDVSAIADSPEPADTAVPVPVARTRTKATPAACCPMCGNKKGLVQASVAAKRLGIPLRTFERTYRLYFSDRRPLKLRKHGARRLIPEDEVDLFVEEGPEAVLEYRRRKGRMTPEEERLLVDGLDVTGTPIPRTRKD